MAHAKTAAAQFFLGGVAAVLLTGCDMPRDPNGTFERVRGGTMRVGVVESPPWARLEGGRPTGIEVELIERFAGQIDAQIEWTRGSESELLEQLEGNSLDVVIGGLKSSTPWSSRVGLTQPFITLQGEGHAMAVPQGENRWLLELDKFLGRHQGLALELYQQALPP